MLWQTRFIPKSRYRSADIISSSTDSGLLSGNIPLTPRSKNAQRRRLYSGAGGVGGIWYGCCFSFRHAEGRRTKSERR